MSNIHTLGGISGGGGGRGGGRGGGFPGRGGDDSDSDSDGGRPGGRGGGFPGIPGIPGFGGMHAGAGGGHGKVQSIADKAAFTKALQAAGGKLVVVDFYADWCGPCKMIAPVVAQLSEKYSNVVFLQVNVDSNSETAQSCGVTAMPTFQFFKKQRKVDELVGANPGKLEAIIKANMTPEDTWSTSGPGYRLGAATGGPGTAPAPAPTAPPGPVPAAGSPAPKPASTWQGPTGGGHRLTDPTPAPGSTPAGTGSGTDPVFASQLAEMGFTQGQIDRAFVATKGNLAAAVEWCLSHPDDGAGQTLGGAAGGGATAPPPPRVPPAADAGAGKNPMDTTPPAGEPAATGDGATAKPGDAKPALSAEEQAVLEDIYGDDGPPEGGISATGGGGGKFAGLPKITADMTPEQQKQILEMRMKMIRERKAAEQTAASAALSEAERIRQAKEAAEARERTEQYKRERERKEAERAKKFEAEERARVLALLEQDKRERAAAKAGMAPVAESPKPVTAVVAPKVDTAECAVQVRLPDGSTINRTFASDAPLKEVMTWVAGHTGVPRGFKLGSTFPKTVFQDASVPLKNLGLGARCQLVVFKQ